MSEQHLRNTDLATLAQALKEQANIREDLVVGSDRLTFQEGHLVVAGHTSITAEGVSPDTSYECSPHFDGQLATTLGIPVKYLRKLRDEHLELLDQNVNGWLPRQSRNFMVRTFRSWQPEGELMPRPARVRSIHSDRYLRIDNEDILMAILEGMQEAGLSADNISGCDLSENHMRLRVVCPEVQAPAQVLLAHYRPSYHVTRNPGGDYPIAWGGFEAGNSETGAGAFYLVPRVVVPDCDNGLKISKDILRRVHLGQRQDEGVIKVGDDTKQKELELVRLKARDAVATFLDRTYVEEVIQYLEQQLCGSELQGNPAETLEVVGKAAGWTEDERDDILGFFIKGGDMRPSGVLQAVTRFTQDVADPDRAAELEGGAIDAALAAAQAR